MANNGKNAKRAQPSKTRQKKIAGLNLKQKSGDGRKVDSEWISSLAVQVVSNTEGKSEIVVSKRERKKRRNEKKRRREERKGVSIEQSVATKKTELQYASASKKTDGSVDRKKPTELLDRLSRRMKMIVEGAYTDEDEDSGPRRKKWKYVKPYINPESSIQGKATAGQQLTESIIQPRKRDYGGLGLTRPSLLLSLRDHSFVPKLQEEFTEHVAGFFGKQRTKAMKKQLDGNMLWKRLHDSKKQTIGKKVELNMKVDGRKLNDMLPDEKVEAMIKLGML